MAASWQSGLPNGACCLPESSHARLTCWLQAHPPIHPIKCSAGEANWSAEKKRLYDFVTRTFLATCSKAAVGFETRVDVNVGGEAFHTTGEDCMPTPPVWTCVQSQHGPAARLKQEMRTP